MDFERIEDLHDLAAGLEHEEYAERIEALRHSDDDAYELDDPKHPTYHDRYADVWDAREGK